MFICPCILGAFFQELGWSRAPDFRTHTAVTTTTYSYSWKCRHTPTSAAPNVYSCGQQTKHGQLVQSACATFFYKSCSICVVCLSRRQRGVLRGSSCVTPPSMNSLRFFHHFCGQKKTATNNHCQLQPSNKDECNRRALAMLVRSLGTGMHMSQVLTKHLATTFARGQESI